MGGMFGNRGNTESREQTIANGKSIVPSCPSRGTLKLHLSKPKDTTSRGCIEAVGGRLSRCDAAVHSCRGAQIHKGAEEHERRGCMPIRCVQTEGDAELHAD